MRDFHTAQWAFERLERGQDRPFFLETVFPRPPVRRHVSQEWFDLFRCGDLELTPCPPDDHDHQDDAHV